MIVSLMKSGTINVDQLRTDTNSDFQFLAPIIDTIANIDKQTREFSLKTFSGILDQEIQDIFDSTGSAEL